MTQDEDWIKAIRWEPHRLGWMMGKTKLRPMHSKWVHHIWHPTESRALQAHRGSYKSTGIVEVGVPWWLLFHPDSRIAIVRKTKTDAIQAISVFRQCFRLPEVRELFRIAHGYYPEAVTEQADHLVFNFKKTMTREGNVDGYGVDSALTGKHYDLIICDDIVGREDRYSAAARVATCRFLEELRTNIIDPGKPVHHIGTPWHRDDAWGTPKREGDPWNGPQPLIYTCYDTGILTPAQIEEKKKITTPSLFAANYLLKHQADDSTLFSNPQMIERWEYGVYSTVHAQIDAAFGGDHTSGLSIFQKLPNGDIQTYGECFDGHISGHYLSILERFRRFRVQKLYIEENADKGFTGRDISRMCQGAGIPVELHPYHERQNKGAKISTILKYNWDHLRFTNDTNEKYLSQITEWIEGQEPDDCCFVASTLISTKRGLVPIENMRIGDFVITPFGFSEVTVVGCSGIKDTIFAHGLHGTATHKTFDTIGKAFVRLDSVASPLRNNLIEVFKWALRHALSSTAIGTNVPRRENIISEYRQIPNGKVLNSFIEQFGVSTMVAKFQLIMRFIIWMAILITMILPIWSVFYNMSIGFSMLNCKIRIPNMFNKEKKPWIESGLLQKIGIHLQRVWNGIGNMHRNQLQKLGKFAGIESVSIVEKTLKVESPMENIAVTDVGVVQEITRVPTIPISVLFAGQPIKTSTRAEENIAVALVKKRVLHSHISKEPVYNLTVKAGCYYANNVLVSNCDSLASGLREAYGMLDTGADLVDHLVRAYG